MKRLTIPCIVLVIIAFAPATALGNMPASAPSSHAKSDQANATPQTPPQSPRRKDEHFLTLASSRELYDRIRSKRIDDKLLAQLARNAEGSNIAAERDECRLLRAMVLLVSGKHKDATAAFADAAHEARTPMIALTALRYKRLLELCPSGIVDGSSIADVRTFDSACRKYANARARQVEMLTSEANRGSLLTLPAWRQAWLKLDEARRAYADAELLGANAPLLEEKLAAFESTRLRVGTAGARLLTIDAERGKNRLLRVLPMLRRDEQGNWGPPRVVAGVNRIVEGILGARNEMRGIAEIVGGTDCGRGGSVPSELLSMASEAGCLKVPNTEDNQVLLLGLRSLFEENTPAADELARPAHCVFQLKVIPITRAERRRR